MGSTKQSSSAGRCSSRHCRRRRCIAIGVPARTPRTTGKGGNRPGQDFRDSHYGTESRATGPRVGACPTRLAAPVAPPRCPAADFVAMPAEQACAGNVSEPCSRRTLLADCVRVLGAEHPLTRTVDGNLRVDDLEPVTGLSRERARLISCCRLAPGFFEAIAYPRRPVSRATFDGPLRLDSASITASARTQPN